jgi:sphinganine-1-phosphate aldolase
VIMYKDKKYIHCQYFVSIDWSGGIFVSPTMAGSRSGGIIAATWASLMNHGQDGYVKASQGIFDTLAFIVNGIRNIKGLTVMGDPKVCIVAFRSDNMNVYCLADEMKKKGWLLGAMQYPIW